MIWKHTQQANCHQVNECMIERQKKQFHMYGARYITAEVIMKPWSMTLYKSYKVFALVESTI